MRSRAQTAFAEPEATTTTGRDTEPATRSPPIRALPIRAMVQALRGTAAGIACRPGMPAPTLALCTALTVLWARVHSYDAGDARWPDRDRFVMSSSSGTKLLYALLHLTGHPGMEQPTLDHCGELDAVAAAAAEHGRHPAIEASAAPGGQAIAAATGMALAERVLAARFGKSLVDHRVWLACAAAELGHGITHEAAAIAGQLRLDRLVLLVDATSATDDARPRYASLGWAVKQADADDPHDIENALSFALRSRKPTLIWCLGRDADAAPEADAAPPAALQAPGLEAPQLEAPELEAPELEAPELEAAGLEAWRRAGARGNLDRRGWLKRIARHPQRPEFERVLAGRLADGWQDGIAAFKAQQRAVHQPPTPAEAGAQLIDRLAARLPEILCGRVPDTLPTGIGQILSGHYSGRYVEYGYRPHALAACANGIALHEGALPITAAALTDTAEQMPALRQAAQLLRRIVHLAFDPGLCGVGAAWQMPGLLAALRAVPRLYLFRPGCAIETAECLELALERLDGPSVMVLARRLAPEVPAPRQDSAENRCARGGYVLAEPDGLRQVTLIATGAELSVARAAHAALARSGIGCAVVSLPCWALFAAQDTAYRQQTLGDALRVGIEAGTEEGWDRWLGGDGMFIGCTQVLAGPEDAVRQRLGLTGDAVAQAVRRRLADTAPPAPQPAAIDDPDAIQAPPRDFPL